jgi:hypothetical protein
LWLGLWELNTTVYILLCNPKNVIQHTINYMKCPRERVWEGEYRANTVYTCMQMEKLHLLELFQGWGKRG